MEKRVLKALLWTVAVYGALAWLYVIAFQVARPESAYWPLAVWLPIRMDYFGETAFLASALSFFTLKVLGNE